MRVHGTGQRGRVLPEEIALISGNPEDRFVAKLKPGEFDIPVERASTTAALLGDPENF